MERRWTTLDFEPLPGVRELVTDNLEAHDVLLNHELHQNVMAVGGEGDTLRPAAERCLCEFREFCVTQAPEHP